jgi:hypothetical protein
LTEATSLLLLAAVVTSQSQIPKLPDVVADDGFSESASCTLVEGLDDTSSSECDDENPLIEDDEESKLSPEQLVQGSTSDPATQKTIDTFLTLVLIESEGPESYDPIFNENIRSRMCGDIFHLHHQFPISLAHGLRRPFSRALNAAIMLPYPEDKAAVEAFLKSKGVLYTSKLRSQPHWVLR